MKINLDYLSDGLSIAAVASEFNAEDHATDKPKIEFSVNKILGERLFDNPSDDFQEVCLYSLFIGLRFSEYSCINSR